MVQRADFAFYRNDVVVAPRDPSACVFMGWLASPEPPEPGVVYVETGDGSVELIAQQVERTKLLPSTPLYVVLFADVALSAFDGVEWLWQNAH